MTAPNLRRELGLFDLTLLLVIAVANINTVSQIATVGWRSMSLWLLVFVLFLIPQAVSVVEFAKRYPGEGGIYLWTREMYGDFHAFISGWCYWTNNLFYFPSVLLILVGALTFLWGPSSAEQLATNQKFMALASLAFLWFVTGLHIRGLSIGKWLNNIGVFGTWFGIAVLIVIGIEVLTHKGDLATSFSWSSLGLSAKEYSDYSTFSIMMYSLVGLELGSVMGDEIKDTRKIIGKAVFLGALISIVLYMIATASVLMAVPVGKIGVVQGLMQAVTVAASDLKIMPVIPVISVLLALAVLGVCSAWMAGAARIPFVMGIDVYLPSVLGRTHPRWGTPYVSLLVQAVLSTIFVLISLAGKTVAEAYGLLLKCSVVLQLIPFLYLFAGLLKLGRKKLLGIVGFATTVFGILFVFVPSANVRNVWLFETQILASSAIMLGLALVFYKIGRRKHKAAV